jgi:hypothetical protein
MVAQHAQHYTQKIVRVKKKPCREAGFFEILINAWVTSRIFSSKNPLATPPRGFAGAKHRCGRRNVKEKVNKFTFSSVSTTALACEPS